MQLFRVALPMPLCGVPGGGGGGAESLAERVNAREIIGDVMNNSIT